MKRPSRISDSSSMCGGAFFGGYPGPSLWRTVSKLLISFQPEFLIGVILILSACQTQGNAPKLQGHLQGAKNASTETSQHIGKTRNSIEVIDYKASRARKLLDEGFSK